jgi:hypothetical protein
VEEKAGNNNLKTQQNLKFNSTLMNFLFLWIPSINLYNFIFSNSFKFRALCFCYWYWYWWLCCSCSQIEKVFLGEVRLTQSNIFSILFFFFECVELWFFNSRLLDSEQQIVDDLGEMFETLIDTVPHLLNTDPLGPYTPKSFPFFLLFFLFLFSLLLSLSNPFLFSSIMYYILYFHYC